MQGHDQTGLPVRRRQDGTLVIQPGSGPVPAERRLSKWLYLGGIAVIGLGGIGVIDALSLTGTAASVLESGAMLAFIAQGCSRLHAVGGAPT